jgi:cellobiose phosphorylase
LKKLGKYPEKILEFEKSKERIRQGLQKHAIVENKLGERKVVHGWGDNIRFKIGSYCDNDGISRDGVTTNAFWGLCGALDWDNTLKKDILAAYDRLDSKYGLKTFEPYFAEDNKDVRRIIRLPKGTAENGATYIHATLFGILSLFEMGESERAWEQIYKILPLTHDKISTSPFIMSNSYVYDEERGYDGESMSDWFTGSGCVLIKILVWEVFGILPTLDGLTVRPTNYFPTDSASIKLNVKGCKVSISYEKSNANKREFIVNGKVKESVYDENAKTEKICFTNEELTCGKLKILIR